MPDEAVRTLRTSLEGSGGLTAGLVCYRLGGIHEKGGNYEEAITSYRKAQAGKGDFTNLIDGIFDSLTKPADDSRIDAAVRHLAGDYDHAEAQFRIIQCFRKLDDQKRTREEEQALIDQYSFSPWAQEVSKATGLKPSAGVFSAFEADPETSVRPVEKEKETLTIIPLNE